jgi:hypothetical protein
MQEPFPHHRHPRPSRTLRRHAVPGPSRLDESVDGVHHPTPTGAPRRIRVSAVLGGSALLALCALAAIISALLVHTVFGGSGAMRRSQTPPHGSGPDTAHLVRSLNIGEYGCGDPFVSDATLRALVARHHVPFIRVPFRDGCSDSQYLATLGAIVSIGAVPQVILHGNCTNSASQQAEDDHWLTLVDQASPNGVYWVEYGNEEDVGCGTGGISVQQYVAGWNRDIPRFRAQHPRARFIGPVTAGHNTAWINYLLAHGTPSPDAISWHWYPCGAGATDSQCLLNTADVENDVAQTDAAMATIGVTVPIWLTEWNEDYTGDSRFGNQVYIQNWMALALQHLTHLHDTANLAVAEFYVLTNESATSDSDLYTPPPADALTYLGAAFFAGI